MKKCLLVTMGIYMLTISNLIGQQIQNDGSKFIAIYDGVDVQLQFSNPTADTTIECSYRLFRLNQEDGVEQQIYSLKNAANRRLWNYTDTAIIQDGYYTYRVEWQGKGKDFINLQQRIAVFSISNKPLFYRMEANPVKDSNAIILSWKLNQPYRARNIQVFSSSTNDNFQLIAVLKSTDTSYQTRSNFLPNEALFFRLQVDDIADGETISSTTVFAIPEFKVTPDAIENLTGSLQDEKPVLSWSTSDALNTRGYYVYRFDPITTDYLQISDIVLGDTKTTEYYWTDTSQNLEPNTGYNYFVVPESHSFTRGKNSDTVIITTLPGVFQLNPPQDLTILQATDSVSHAYHLIWTDQSETKNQVAYYEIFRKRKNEIKFSAIEDSIVLSELNYVHLKNPKDGDEYYVVSGNGEQQSAPSEIYSYNNVFEANFGPKYLKAEVVDEKLWIKWLLPQDETIISFRLYKWNGTSFELLETIDSTTDLIEVKNYLAGENNTYYITALKSTGEESEPSNKLTVF